MHNIMMFINQIVRQKWGLACAVIVLCILVGTWNARANDQELYDPAPPPDSAFVRLINASGEAAPLTGRIGGLLFESVPYPGISDYQAIKAGHYTLSAGNITGDVTLAAGSYYSLAVTPQAEVVPIEDAPVVNPAKSMVYFYNFSGQPDASLDAPQHGASIISQVTSGSGQSREVNALTLDLAVTSGGQTVVTFDGVALKRRGGMSFVLTGSADALQAKAVQNSVAR